MKNLFSILIIVFALMIVLVSTAYAERVTTMSWGVPTTYSDGTALLPGEISGYTIWCGVQSGSYSSAVDVGYVQSVDLGQVIPVPDGLYYCAGTVSVIWTGILPSNYSNEVEVMRSGPDFITRPMAGVTPNGMVIQLDK